MNRVIENLLSIRATDRIANITSFLSRDGINGFTHDITFGQGRISLLSDRKDLLSFYLKNDFPVVCCSEDGRILPSGVYLNQKLTHDYVDYSKLYSIVSKELKFKNTIHIVEREEAHQHLYSFTFSLPEINFLHFVSNKINKLRLFIRNYKFQAKELIQEASLNKNRVTLPFCGKQNDKFIAFSSKLRTDLNETLSIKHRDTYETVMLAPQQMRCLTLLIKGYSAKEIAHRLSLSPRTVNHYLERLRKILGCRNSKELISEYYSQVNNRTL